MKKQIQNLLTITTLAIATLSLSGCGSSASETKPMDEVRAEAQEADSSKLEAIVEDYTAAIAAKKEDMEKVTAKLKEIPMTEMLGDDAKALKAEISTFKDSVSALNERMAVYAKALKEQQKN